MRPVLHGLCKYESLKDGTLTLCDVALMNDALDVKQDNELIAQQHLNKLRQNQ